MGSITLTDDRMILICAFMFFVGAIWGGWIGYCRGQRGDGGKGEK
jgi:hypothetical protein